MNQIVLVGRINKEIELKELENGGKVANITLAVTRPYKNLEGIYETDFIDINLFNVIAENTKEYCKKGDLVGVKGRIETKEIELNSEKTRQIVLIAEKVTFLSNKKEDEE